MDTIEFRLSAFYNNTVTSQAVAHIFINGKNFSDTLYEFESRAGLKSVDYAPLAVAVLYENLCAMSHAAEIYDRVIVNVAADDETVTWKIFGEFVFDKAQYLREVDKLKRWCDNDKLFIEYGCIECGDIKLVVKKAQAYEFWFDEILEDPLPDLVKFFNAVRGGEDYFDVNIMRDDGHVAFKLSIKRWFDGMVRFCVELVGEKIIFCEWLQREELAAMFKKIFDALLNDKYFPYSYPCFWYLSENYDTKYFDDVIDAIEAEHPYWTTGDVWNYAVEAKSIKLAPRHEKYLEHYKKMLTTYTIPDKWFE